jgi:DivIVA domain-containing protein
MMWVFAILVVLAMGGVALVASGRTGALPEEYDDRPDVLVPAGRLAGDDVRRVRFSLAFRGYRMSEVDTLLSRLAAQLDEARRDDIDRPDASRGGSDPD